MLLLGRDIREGTPIYLEASKSRAILICGKRGSGKSYTLGVLIEELLQEERTIIIIIDPMGIYHPMVQPNSEQASELYEWGLNPKGLPVKLLVPGDPLKNYAYGQEEILELTRQRGIRIEPLRINPSDLSPDGWCDLFDLNINEVMGIGLFRAIQNLLRRTNRSFFLPEIIDEIETDGRTPQKSKEALLNRLEWVASMDIFSTSYRDTLEVFEPGIVNIVDLKCLDPGRYNLRNLIVSILAKDLFKKRSMARAKEELGLSSGIPKVWMAIDEAHQFVPAARGSLSKEYLIRWVKEGRQPGTSLVVVSQQPSAIDRDVLSQCDVIVSHKLTTKEDIDALNNLSQDYMAQELRAYIRKLSRIGEAVLVDDDAEKVFMVSIRPRKSRHGGGEST